MIVTVTGVVSARKLIVIAYGDILSAYFTVLNFGLTARGVILTVAEVLTTLGTKHSLTALAGVVTAIERLVVAKAKVIPTMLTQGMLTDVTGVMSALKHGVVVAVAKVGKAGHTLSMLTVLASKVAACKFIVLSTLTSRMSAGVKRVVKAVAKILAAALTE